MSVLALPMAPAGSVQEQVTQQYAYLVQMAQQLNLALGLSLIHISEPTRRS